MTNPKEVLEHIRYEQEKKTKARRELAIMAFNKLIESARINNCIKEPHCDTCIYRIDPDLTDYIDAPDGKNCYARRFHEEAIAMLARKEGIR